MGPAAAPPGGDHRLARRPVPEPTVLADLGRQLIAILG